MRSFRVSDLVQLPNLTASGAIAVAQQIMTVAEAEPELPSSVEDALGDVSDAHATLHDAVSRQQLAPADARAQVEADVDLDAAWRSLSLLCTSHLAVPGENVTRAVAARVDAALFPDGLRFTQLPYRNEWAESDTRIARIRRDKLDDEIRALGGQVQLDAVYAAHETYGHVLGITHAASSPSANPSVREPLDSTMQALRTYVVRVAASIDDSDSETAARADRLLRPLRDWPTRSRSQPPPAPPPGAPAAGDGTTV